MIAHYNDGVAGFGPSLAVQAPEWLGGVEERPPSVPRSQRWIPITTFVQALIDTRNAAREVPGVFDADGHDYRGDLLPFMSAVLGFDASEEARAAIVAAFETEVLRTLWIEGRGEVGENMAAVILDRLREQNPEGFDTAVRSVGQDLVAQDRESSA